MRSWRWIAIAPVDTKTIPPGISAVSGESCAGWVRKLGCWRRGGEVGVWVKAFWQISKPHDREHRVSQRNATEEIRVGVAVRVFEIEFLGVFLCDSVSSACGAQLSKTVKAGTAGSVVHPPKLGRPPRTRLGQPPASHRRLQ